MKKLIWLLVLLTAFSIQAQKKEKIKGNREVLIKKFTVPFFTGIEVGEKFEVNLQKSADTTRVVIETDDNLFDVIHFAVENEVLRFSTSMEIVKKKRLRITVFVPESFQKIQLKEKGKVYTEEALHLTKLRLQAIEKGKAELMLDLSESVDIEAADKTDLKIDAVAPKAQLHLTDHAELNGKWQVKEMEINLDDHAFCKLEGSAKHLKLFAQSKAKYEGNNFEIEKAEITAKDKAKLKLKISGTVTLKLSGQTQTELYGNPKINLKTFKDNASLFKK